MPYVHLQKLLVYCLLLRKYSGAVVTFTVTIDILNCTTIIVLIINTINIIIIIVFVIVVVLPPDMKKLQMWYAVIQIYLVSKLESFNRFYASCTFQFSYGFDSEGKRPMGRPRRRWEDNIKMDLEEVGRGCGEWMELAKDWDRWRTLGSTVMNFPVA